MSLFSTKAEAEPTPPAQGGRKPMSPSDRARHASLVRWGKEQPFAARLAAVRERRKRAKAGKGKKPKAAKPTPEQLAAEKDKQAAANVASVGDALNQTDNAFLSKAGLDGLAAAASGQEPGSNVAEGLIKKGLAVRGEDGRYRLTSDGKALVRAAQSGDVNAVLDKISEVNDKNVAKQEKEAAASGGGGGGSGAKKPTPEEKTKEREAEKTKEREANRGAVRDAMAQSDQGLAPAGFDNLIKLSEGTAPDEQGAAGLISMGVAERGTDGTLRLTPAGRQAVNAANRGDAKQAIDAISKGAERATQGKEKEQERTAQEEERETERATREQEKEARNQERERVRTARKERVQNVALRRLDRTGKLSDRQSADLEEAGLVEFNEKGDPVLTAEGRARLRKPEEKKAIMSDYQTILEQIDAVADDFAATADADAEIKAGKRHSGSDQTIVQQIYDTACDLAEMAVALGASEEMDEGDEMMEGKAQQTFGGKKREDLDDSDFAGPDRTYPIVTAADVADAASLIGKADNPEAVKRKIISIAKRKGFPLPEAWETKAEPTVSLPTDFLIGDEVKSLADGRIGAYAVRFGSEAEPDMSHMRDYFTKSTDFWLDAWDRRPMLYHHAMDDDTADAPRIGTWTKAEVKDEGVWLEGQLDKGHRYYSAIKELVRRGVLRLSSDSAPHLVRREVKEGAHEVTRWPLLAASLTPTPAEPRLSAVSFKSLLDELGIDPIVIDDNPEVDASESDRSDETKALAERSRRLLLITELELAEATI